jgi:hypothetical protein
MMSAGQVRKVVSAEQGRTSPQLSERERVPHHRCTLAFID